MEWMQILWAAILIVSVIMYTVLDGFDLGVGNTLLAVKGDKERRIMLNAIGPLWDGNEVWLIIIGGGLFAGFPSAYATLFSAMYVPTMFLLGGIIFRAVAIEFRSKRESYIWRQTWDILFAVASGMISFIAGVFIANLLIGLPVDGSFNTVPNSLEFFTPYTILVGLMAVALFANHGNLFLMFKTEGELQEKIRSLFMPGAIAFIVLYLAVTAATIYVNDRMFSRFLEYPLFMIIPVLAVVSMLLMIYCQRRKMYGRAFLCSALTIILLFINFAIGVFPNIITSTIDPSYSMTVFNSSASETTMKVILTIAAIGVPLVLLYGYILYSTFWGKTKITTSSY